jgi:hypothetical protein
MINMEATMNKSAILISRWEKEEIERNIKEGQRVRTQSMNSIRDLLYQMEFNNLKARMTDSKDLINYEDIKAFSSLDNALNDSLLDTRIFKLNLIMLEYLNDKYYLSTDRHFS